MFRRGRFTDVISRQLDLFIREEADLIRECEEAERAYNNAARDEETSEAYEDEFNRAVLKRLPRFALEIENR